MFDTDYILSLASMYVLGLVSAPTFQRPARRRGARYVMQRYATDVDDYRAVILEWRDAGLVPLVLARFRDLGGSLLATPDAVTVDAARCMPQRVRSFRSPRSSPRNGG